MVLGLGFLIRMIRIRIPFSAFCFIQFHSIGFTCPSAAFCLPPPLFSPPPHLPAPPATTSLLCTTPPACLSHLPPSPTPLPFTTPAHTSLPLLLLCTATTCLYPPSLALTLPLGVLFIMPFSCTLLFLAFCTALICLVFCPIVGKMEEDGGVWEFTYLWWAGLVVVFPSGGGGHGVVLVITPVVIVTSHTSLGLPGGGGGGREELLQWPFALLYMILASLFSVSCFCHFHLHAITSPCHTMTVPLSYFTTFSGSACMLSLSLSHLQALFASISSIYLEKEKERKSSVSLHLPYFRWSVTGEGGREGEGGTGQTILNLHT